MIFLRCCARNWSVRHINSDYISGVDWRRLRFCDELNVVIFNDILGGDDLNQRRVGRVRYRQISYVGFFSAISNCPFVLDRYE